MEDKSELISYLRVIKSDEEIVYVRKAAELADNALNAVWKTAKAGVNEGKILAEMQKIVFDKFLNIEIPSPDFARHFSSSWHQLHEESIN